MSISKRPLGHFICIEGPDGVGKTTQLQMLRQYLESKGMDVTTVREPGGTLIGEGVRELFKANFGHTDPEAEVLMLLAARQQLYAEVIAPALVRGAWVLSDRHTPSTFAYQGAGQRLGFTRVIELRAPLLRSGGHMADFTMILEVPAEERERRLAERGEFDRIDTADREFKDRVAGAYHEMLHGNWELWMGLLEGVNGVGAPEEVHARVVATLEASPYNTQRDDTDQAA